MGFFKWLVGFLLGRPATPHHRVLEIDNLLVTNATPFVPPATLVVNSATPFVIPATVVETNAAVSGVVSYAEISAPVDEETPPVPVKIKRIRRTAKRSPKVMPKDTPL